MSKQAMLSQQQLPASPSPSATAKAYPCTCICSIHRFLGCLEGIARASGRGDRLAADVLVADELADSSGTWDVAGFDWAASWKSLAFQRLSFRHPFHRNARCDCILLKLHGL